MGHQFFNCNHCFMQSKWYPCSQPIFPTSSPVIYSSWKNKNNIRSVAWLKSCRCYATLLARIIQINNYVIQHEFRWNQVIRIWILIITLQQKCVSSTEVYPRHYLYWPSILIFWHGKMWLIILSGRDGRYFRFSFIQFLDHRSMASGWKKRSTWMIRFF